MECALDRRQGPDRRAHPTTLWSTLRWQGRRIGFRRRGEGRQCYVDGLARRIVGLAVVVYMSSILDALLTLRYLADGGGEANPLMRLALAYGPTVFVALKLGITGGAGGCSRPISSGGWPRVASTGWCWGMGRCWAIISCSASGGCSSVPKARGKEDHEPIKARHRRIEARPHGVGVTRLRP